MGSAPEIRVAIIGAGIVGIVFAHALLERSIPVTIYEQSPEIRVTGGGINANPSGVRALKRCAKKCYEAFLEVRATHHLERPELYWTIVEGENVLEVTTDEEYGSMPRRKFVEALVKRLPPGTIRFDKRLTKLDMQPDQPIRVGFGDGSTEVVDVLFGCDGVNSKTRTHIFGEEFKASFSHKIICRALVSIEAIENLMGPELAKGAHLDFGHGDSRVWYPVDKSSGNLGYAFHDENEWPHAPNPIAKWSRQELLTRMQSLDASPKHLALGNLFPDEVDVWGIMHMETPLPTFTKGRTALLGDAAHASTVFLGAGATEGYKDAAVCAELLLAVVRQELGGRREFHAVLEAALRAYSDSRMERSQAVVRNSYYGGQVQMGLLPAGQGAREYARLTHEVWQGDIDEMVETALKQLDGLMQNGIMS